MSALLSAAELAEQGPAEAVRLPLELVDPNPNNPRAQLVEIDALADNISTFGLLQPVTVRRAGERYELLGGHRRRAAFELLAEREPHEIRWRSIPAVIRTADDALAERMLISGQVHVRAWKPREEAAALERLRQTGLSLKQVGEAVNRTESWASKRLKVYADAVLSGFVQSETLNPSVAEVFLSVRDPDLRLELARRAASEHWAQPQAKAELRKLTLESQLRDVSRRAAELAEILSSIDPSRLPIGATRDLWVLHGRIEVLAKAGQPKIPPLVQVGRPVEDTPRQRLQRRRARRKPGR